VLGRSATEKKIINKIRHHVLINFPVSFRFLYTHMGIISANWASWSDKPLKIGVTV